MNRSSQVLASILGLGLLFSFYRLCTGRGGSGLGDFIDGLGYTSLILFAASFIILIINIRQINQHSSTIFFLLLGLPLMIVAAGNFIKHKRLSKEPDLTVKYPLPVCRSQYVTDSVNIKIAIDSAITLYNKKTGGAKKISAFIDTVIYSERGNKVFVSYAEKFEPNGLGNDLEPAFLYSESRDNGVWNLHQVNYNLSGGYHDTAAFKKAVRRFYFNRFSFLDKDSLNKNFFWRRIIYPGG